MAFLPKLNQLNEFDPMHRADQLEQLSALTRLWSNPAIAEMPLLWERCQ